jgi:HEAT repeat protein
MAKRRCRRVLPLLLLMLACAHVSSAQAPAARDLPALVGHLGDLEYRTRMNAARQIRRAPAPDAIAALTAAIKSSSDEFVRYRALVLLTGLGDRNTPALVQSLIADKNDRVREVSYRWLADHPDANLISRLLQALQTEQAEFVRPVLVRALAVLDGDSGVQRALLNEAGRGLDFFRIAVIEAMGQRRAIWALPTVTEVAKVDGPLQDDAVIALGRIGEPRSLPVVAAITAPPEVVMAAHAARCLLGDDCPGRIAALNQAITSRIARPEVVRAGTLALGVIAESSDAGLNALAALIPNMPVRDSAIISLGGVALREPPRFLKWFAALPQTDRLPLVDALKEAFERFEEDYAEEQFYAAARAAYWAAPDGSPARDIMADLIDKLEF